MKTIYLAGGCFWGTQHFVRKLRGVVSTRVGYANGNTENPTYDQVKYEHTGHAETVEVVFDETVLPVEKLLNCYYMTIDPLSVNRQGMDFGVQYRTGIYYTDAELVPAIEASLAALAQKLGQKPAIEVCPLRQFFEAEPNHQDYLMKNPTGYCHISPELLTMAGDL